MSDIRHAAGKCEVGQRGAAQKRIVPNARNAVRNSYAGQAGAMIKRTIPDFAVKKALTRIKERSNPPTRNLDSLSCSISDSSLLGGL